MIHIRVFGSDTDREQYQVCLKRARLAAAQFEGNVDVSEHEAWGELAEELGIAGSPAVAVDDDIISVRSVPAAQSIIAAIERRLVKETG